MDEARVGTQVSDLAALASLNEPLRRRLYGYVAGRPAPVGRDEAAAAVEVARSVAAFHLDRLVEVGLLEVEFRRPPGKGGPGAGRPAKLYRPAGREVSVTVPERHYDVVGRLLARAVARAERDGVTPSEAARLEGRLHGQEIAAAAVAGSARRSRAGLAEVARVLSGEGYRARVEGRRLVLDNCPFHAVADDQREVVCGVNLALVEGVLDGLGSSGLEARLEPAPGRCCVEVRRG
ncbi:MAG TPA: helix-turn-helix domain-containing protein [Acidimicrobiales bacterium]|nr:helix-turn-helix domain-containing protein [Acidimicrobiales bacterium]